MVEQNFDTAPQGVLDQVVIRLLRKEDLPGLEWDGEFKHFHNLYADTYERMVRGLTSMWVAEIPEKGIIGQVFLQLVCDRPELADGWQRAYLFSFRIKPEYRNLGLGTRVVQVLEDYLLEKRYSRITLNVGKDNPDAARLYKRLGFQVVAEEPGVWSYIDDKGNWQTVREPSWRMEKLLRSNNRFI
ncbi:MAG: GNAT family N-acetyltransferase [Anaerolineaceae bacterium]|jgi:ribosomal protein S18 acetylase RimI-like enzyme